MSAICQTNGHARHHRGHADSTREGQDDQAPESLIRDRADHVSIRLSTSRAASSTAAAAATMSRPPAPNANTAPTTLRRSGPTRTRPAATHKPIAIEPPVTGHSHRLHSEAGRPCRAGRASPLPTTTTVVAAIPAHMPTRRKAATESPARCHPADIAARAVAIAASPPAAATGRRQPSGRTNSTATTTEKTAVVCPLGRLLCVEGVISLRPRSGRESTWFFSSQVDAFAATTRPIATRPSDRRSRISAVTAIAAIPASNAASDTTPNTASTACAAPDLVRMAPRNEASPNRLPGAVRTVTAYTTASAVPLNVASATGATRAAPLATRPLLFTLPLSHQAALRSSSRSRTTARPGREAPPSPH